MNEPKVSVIIPFYSNVKWLKEAVESVLAQTYKNYEIIIVNDGSKEDLADFLLEYENKIIYLEQENQGPAAARNNGIRYASGEYIAFEDSDDIWLPTKLEKQIAFMEECGAMWSHTGFYYWYPESGKQIIVENSNVYDDIFLQRLISTKIATPSIVIKKSIIEKDNLFFPEETRNGEDDQLYTKIAKLYSIALIKEPLVRVRMRGSNSYTKVIERFHLRRTNYLKWKEDKVEISCMGEIIYRFYKFYASVFDLKYSSNKLANFIAKCCWTIPYFLERIYLKYLYKILKKDKRYIKIDAQK